MKKQIDIEARKKALDDTLKQLEDGVRVFRDSESFKAYLSCMAKFHNYSFNNSLLIYLQCPHATRVGSFTLWKSLGRSVNKGEKGLRILAPSPFKVEVTKADKDGKPILDDKGEPIKEQKTIMAYKPTTTFDISQTSGASLDDLPIKELVGGVEHYKELFDAISHVANCPITFEDIEGGARGYFSPGEHRIAIKNGMDEKQNLKTLLHETIHSKLDNLEMKENKDLLTNRSGKETRAEASAYVVCSHFGIDTGDYSFPYLASWGSKNLEELREQMDIIRNTSNEVIMGMEEYLAKHLGKNETMEKTITTQIKPKHSRKR